MQEPIDAFLNGAPHAVVGASQDRAKYGNKVLRAYMQKHMVVYPINPTAQSVEGATAFPKLSAVPERLHGVSVITPPHVTEIIVEQAAVLGIQHIWMQPGAESDVAIARAQELGLNCIADGSCILVLLGYRD